MDPILQVELLRKNLRSKSNWSSTEIIKGLSFQVPRGTITGFLGANGAGKTTTIKCLLGLIFPDSGQINFFGEGYNTPSVKSKIGFLPERPYFYEYLTGEEFLRFMGQLSKRLLQADLDRRIDELLSLVELQHARKKSLREYSKGMLQRVGIAQALIHNPEFVILDEPKSGLDPDGRYKVSEILKQVAHQGTTVFFSSHLLNDAEAICNHLVIIKKGELVYQGGLQSLLNRLQSGYLMVTRKGESVVETRLQDEAHLQSSLKQALADGLIIHEVRPIRPTLEKAFIEMASK